MHWYLEALKKYAIFSGRARRKEYWLFYLISIIIGVVPLVLDVILGTYSDEAGVGLLSSIYQLGMFIPGIAVSVRRLHDTNHSGWWLLITLVPLVSVLFVPLVFNDLNLSMTAELLILSVFFLGPMIVLLVFMVSDGQLGPNRFGTNPKESPESALATTAVPPQPAPQEERPVYCTTCGTKFPETAAYCSRCGAMRSAV